MFESKYIKKAGFMAVGWAAIMMFFDYFENDEVRFWRWAIAGIIFGLIMALVFKYTDEKKAEKN